MPPVARRPIKAVPITLDRDRTIVYDLNALAELEDRTGRNMLDKDALSVFLDKPTAKDLRLFLWAGLIHEDPALQPADVGRFLTISKMVEISGKIGEAFGNSMPEPPEATEDGEGSDASPLVGPPSGQSDAST